MRYDAASDHYVPIMWEEAFVLIGRKLRALESADQAEFYTSGRTTFSLVACVVLFGLAAVGQVQARGGGAGGHTLGANRARPFLDSVPSVRPHFNPSIPYTVPQSRETPVSPASPGAVFGN